MSFSVAARGAITLQLLESFLVLAETLHYGRAAEQLYVSQPTLSRQIQRLEASVGHPLFSRRGRRVELTPAGRVMQTHAARIVEQTRLAGVALAELEGGATQLLQLGCFDSAHGFLVPRLVANFRKLHSDVALRTTTMPSRDGLMRVRQGTLDAAVVAGPMDAERLEERALFTERLVVIMPPQHALTRDREVRVEDLAGETLVTSAPGRNLRDAVDQVLMRMEVDVTLLEIQGAEAVKDAVREGLGLGILGEVAVHGPNHSSGLQSRPLVPATTRRVSLVVQHQRREDPMLRDLADVAEETARTLGLPDGSEAVAPPVAG